MSSPSEKSDDTADTNGTDGTDVGVGDDQLPEDLVPGDDNPLAEGLDDGETVDDLMEAGKPAEESSDDDSDGADSQDSED